MVQAPMLINQNALSIYKLIGVGCTVLWFLQPAEGSGTNTCHKSVACNLRGAAPPSLHTTVYSDVSNVSHNSIFCLFMQQMLDYQGSSIMCIAFSVAQFTTKSDRLVSECDR